MADLSKLLAKPGSLLLGVAGGMVAGQVFKQVWKRISGEDDAPQATSDDYGWGEVLLAAAIHGALFAVVKAAIDRGTNKSVRRLTGQRPNH